MGGCKRRERVRAMAGSWWCAASKMLTKQPARAAEDGAGGVGDRGEEGARIVVQSVRQGLGLRRLLTVGQKQESCLWETQAGGVLLPQGSW